MRKEDIISKGKYSYPQPEQLISAKEYLFARDGDKKTLLLRFSNQRAEACTSFGFILYRLDARGKILGEERFESSQNTSFRPNGTFAFDRKIEVEEKCTDFRIKLLFASYGDYIYKVENGDTVVDFKEVKKEFKASSYVSDKNHIKPRKITHRTLDMPGLFAILTLVILAVAFLITGYQLRNFMDEEVEFTLAGLRYEFVNEDEKDPGDDVVIVGATERYENILIPSEIEGYKVVGVDEGAFKNDTVIKNVKVDGVDIGKEVFAGCENLQTVELIDVKYIGENAFKGCKSLTEITADSLERIDNEAFSGCRNLETVEFTHEDKNNRLYLGEKVFVGCNGLESVTISQMIIFPENIAIFDGVTSLENLTLKNFAYTVPPVEIEDEENSDESIDSILPFAISKSNATIVQLFGEADIDEISLETLSIDYIDALPADFCKGLKNLKTVKINNSRITVIPENAFYGCNSLTEFDASKVTAIGDGAFYGCFELKNTGITEQTPLKSIGDQAFFYCSNLDNVVVPKTVKSIGDQAFANCSVEVFEFPSELENFGKEILLGCSNIKSLTLSNLTTDTLGYIFGEKGSGSSVPSTLKQIKVLSCTEVPKNAFKKCASLEKVELPDTVETIGPGAFDGCTALYDIVVPAGVKSVGANAFRYTKITTINLSNATFIGAGVFTGCSSLKEVTIPFLGDSASAGETTKYFAYFYGASQANTIGYVFNELEKITITGNMEKVPNYAFYDCSGVKQIVFANKVAEIGNSAFASCDNLEVLDISGAVVIGNNAFQGTSIKEAVFSDQITLIPASVFRDNEYLEKVTLGSAVQEIATSAFEGCVSLKQINMPSSLKKIGSKAFYKAQQLEEADLKNVTSVEQEAFAYTALKKVELSSGAEVQYGAFKDCGSIEEITVPMPSGTISTFGYLFDATNSQIPRSIKKVTALDIGVVEYGAFDSCKYIEELYLVGATSIKSYSVSYCDNLRYIEIPSTVLSINSSAFTGSYKLYEITNKSSVTLSAGGYGAGENAIYVANTRAPYAEKDGFVLSLFDGVWYLTNTPKKETITVPSSFTYNNETVTSFKIPKNFMRGEVQINKVTFPKGVSGLGTQAFYGSYLEEIIFDKDSAFEKIPTDMFYGSSELKKVTLPSGITSIGASAFESCSQLSSVEIGSNVTSIGTNAFYGCTRLYDVYNYSELTIVAGSTTNGYVGRYALKIHTSVDSKPSDEVVVDGVGVFRNKDNEWLLVSYTGYDETLDLTNIKINGQKLTSFRIAENAFKYNSTIKTIIADSSLKQIQSGAFSDCSALRKVDLTYADIDQIERDVFYNCTALRYVYLPDSVKEISSQAFYNCRKLEKIDMPNDLEKISSYAFYNCSRLVSITIPKKVTSIGTEAFASCSNLYEVINLSGLSVIRGSSSNGYLAYNAKGVFDSESNAYERNTTNGCMFILINDIWYLYSTEENLQVTLLQIPNFSSDITIIPNAFYGANIKNIFLSKSVKTIKSNAFYDISNMVGTVYYEGTIDDYYNIVGTQYIYGRLYYYNDCVHDTSSWTYKNNAISTEQCNLTYEVSIEATCFNPGEKLGTCDCGCGYTDTVYVNQLSHMFINNVCSNCKLQRVTVESTIFEQFVDKGIITVKDFEYNLENQRFESTIQGQANETAKFIINAEATTDVTLTYGASCEAYGDYLYIKHNGSTLETLTGDRARTRVITLQAGDTLTIEYKKDSLVDEGFDLVYINNLTILMKP